MRKKSETKSSICSALAYVPRHGTPPRRSTDRLAFEGLVRIARPAFSQSGLALITVLWSILILSFIASQVLDAGRGDIRLASGVAADIRAQAMADGAIEVAVAGLLRSGDSTSPILPDGSIYGWSFNNGNVFIRVTPESWRVDLNASSKALLEDLFTAAGASTSEAVAVTSAVASYRGDGANATARRTPFRSVQQLVELSAMNGALFAKVQSNMTVHGGQASPDRNTGLPIVSAALNNTAGATSSLPELPVDKTVTLSPLPSVVEAGNGKRPSTATTYRIEATAIGPNQGRAAREAIVYLAPGALRPYRLLSLRTFILNQSSDAPNAR